ncbi:hypothetical protein TNCV_3228831 [Trichonephila clavipes]|nr:hypothetical protein TNCV_3228831 [Trichonephila clavipes]
MLKRHFHTHTDEKLHVCEVCNKAFSVSVNLKKHLLVHNMEKPHVCELCTKAFSPISTVKDHFHIHTKQKLKWSFTYLMPPFQSPPKCGLKGGTLNILLNYQLPTSFYLIWRSRFSKELQNCDIFQAIELFNCRKVKPNSSPCTLSLKDYSKNRRVDGTRSRQDLQPQLLLISRQYRQALKIQQKSSFSPSSPKTALPHSTTEVIPRFSPALPKRPRQHQRQR